MLKTFFAGESGLKIGQVVNLGVNVVVVRGSRTELTGKAHCGCVATRTQLWKGNEKTGRCLQQVYKNEMEEMNPG